MRCIEGEADADAAAKDGGKKNAMVLALSKTMA